MDSQGESNFSLQSVLKMVASAILADVEPVRLARRKQFPLGINLVKSGVSTMRTVFSGRQDADLYGRRDARRYSFRPALSIWPSALLHFRLVLSTLKKCMPA